MFNQGALGAAAARAGDIGRRGPPSYGGGGSGWRGRGLISLIAFFALMWRAMFLLGDMGLHGGWLGLGALIAIAIILWQAVFAAYGLFGYVIGALVAGLAAANVSVGWTPDQAHTGGYIHDIPFAIVVFLVVGIDQWFVKKARTYAKS